MAHKTLIDGTAYEINGGKTLINGTAYEIKGGKTLVGGTVYDIEFTVVVTIVPCNSSTADYKITIDGQTYDNTIEAPIEIVVPKGTLVNCSVMPAMLVKASIYVGDIFNRTEVATSEKNSGVYATYTHELVEDTTITMGNSLGTIYITIEEN